MLMMTMLIRSSLCNECHSDDILVFYNENTMHTA
jgi:hypothetical protein